MAIKGDEGKAVGFPFSIDASGSIFSTEDESVIWEDRVRCVLLTNVSERVMRPDFGSRLSDLIYENDFGQTKVAEKAASAAFTKWFPTLTLDSVLAVADTVNGGLLVQVDYTLPSGQKQQTAAKVTVATLNRYGDIVVGG
jgi:phage baseplate assembly protein W